MSALTLGQYRVYHGTVMLTHADNVKYRLDAVQQWHRSVFSGTCYSRADSR
jgi:hypothetical protein